MLNIEVIKFEAQDVITASGIDCTCDHTCKKYNQNKHGHWEFGKWSYVECKATEHNH